MRRVLLAGGALLGAALLWWWPGGERVTATPAPAPPAASVSEPPEEQMAAARRVEAATIGAGAVQGIDPSRPRGPGMPPEIPALDAVTDVPLVRPSGLCGTVTDHTGEPRASITVRLPLHQPPHLPKTEAATNEQGRYEMEVPAGELFFVELVDSIGRVLQREEGRLTLVPGEILHKDFVLGRTSAVHGRATDPTGVPVPAFNVWLVRSTVDGPSQRDARDASKTFAQCLTGADGSFRFEGVPSGRYAVGPGLQPAGTDDIGGAAARHFEGLRVDGTGEDVERDLVVTRGLWITGVVRQQSGLPASGAEIRGRWAGITGNVLVKSDMDGRFRLGPLAGGLIELRVHHASGKLETSVEAGSQEVELVLAAGGSIRVALVPPGDAIVACAAEGWPVISMAGHGHAQFEGLLPGCFDVIVKTDGGRFGLAQDVQVRSGETTHASVESIPGAWIRMSRDDTLPDVTVSLREDDTWVGSVWLERGQSALETVPAGRPIRLRARTLYEVWEQETTVTLEPGEIREIVFPLDG